MREDIKKRLLAKSSINSSASPPSDPEQQPMKRLKEHGESTSDAIDGVQVAAEVENDAAGKKTIKSVETATAIATATTNEGSSSASFSFPLNLTSTLANDTSNPQVSAAMGLSILQQQQQQGRQDKIPILPSTLMEPPPTRAPRALNRPPLPPREVSIHIGGPASAIVVGNSTLPDPTTQSSNHQNDISTQQVLPPPALPSAPTLGASATAATNGGIQDNTNQLCLPNIQIQLSCFLPYFNLQQHEWRQLVALMQGAIAEHAGLLTNQRDTIRMLEFKLMDAENQATRDRAEVTRLKSQVESMNMSMVQMGKLIEDQFASRRMFEEKVLSSLLTGQYQGQKLLQQPRQEPTPNPNCNHNINNGVLENLGSAADAVYAGTLMIGETVETSGIKQG